ncbi:sterile alpha motif domain-containing protein 1 [Herpailurus yagouaroundi]|uniref:sterile alpha motif domain-containing protein 1 n=1 Tax=Herpailurus yagouaroundi TaxID=1608482 RepID=UPI001AD68FC9|nr:atherin [Puma yagouaroundi]
MAGPPALPPPETAAAATTAAAASSSAASPHYQEWILDTIDSLRSRKARPDLERICRMVRRRHGPEPERTRAELEKLIQQRAVLRVSYKGSISYRNAARVQPTRPRSARVRSGSGPGGSGGAGGRLTRGRVQGLLEEEAAARGRLERTRLGALALPRGDRPGRAPPAASARASRSKRGGEERVLEKEEEEEEDEDEDDEDDVSEGSEVPEGDRPAGAQHHQLNGERGPQSAKERVKEWTPCGPLQGQDEGRGPAPGSGTRQVFSMAAMNKEGGSASAATGPDSPSPVPLPPGKPALPGADGTPFGCPSGRKEKPADPVEWTVMDVVEYFTEAGFPEQATAFQEQEIDGKSLLLMQRTDVLTGLSIRLGPALKIYEHHIKVLQQGHFEDDDPDGFLG